MFISKLSLESARTQTINYFHSVNRTIFNSAGIMYLAIKENKKSTFFAVISSISYGALSYYAIVNQAKIITDWYGYKSVFSLLASTAKNEQFCSVRPISFGYGPKICLAAEGNLFASLSKAKEAAAKHLALSFFKPLMLMIAERALSFSLCSALIKKWLENNNNQLGLKMMDNKIAMETREIIYDYSDRIVSCIIGRVSSMVDLILAIAKMYDIYQVASELESQEADFNLLEFIALAIGTFLVTNFILHSISKRYTDSALKNQALFKNDLTFNMDNALQVECSRATNHEFNLLQASLVKVTKVQARQRLISTSISTVGMIFTTFFNLVVLGFSIPMLARNPAFYFRIERLGNLITTLSFNLWSIFENISSSSTLHYASAKVKKFINLIDEYQALLANRRDFNITVDPTANLSCHLTIKYPENSSDSPSSYKVLVNNFTKEFVAGNLYVISGPSGSGKTSFFNALIGVNPYATGQVTITRQENIIYVPQKPVFKQNLSWMQTILYPLPEEDYFNIELEQKILEWVRILALESVYNNSKTSRGWINYLSGGEAQRLSLIQALAKIFICKEKSNDKVLLLLDEAMNALDSETQEKTFNLIARQVKENEIIAIHIDHSDRRIIRERYAKECIIYFDELNKTEM